MPFAKADGSADNYAAVVSWSGERMNTLFLGDFAASVAPRVLAKVKAPLETSILDDVGDLASSADAYGDTGKRWLEPASHVVAGVGCH
jgi:hypothetical protein